MKVGVLCNGSLTRDSSMCSKCRYLDRQERLCGSVCRKGMCCDRTVLT